MAAMTDLFWLSGVPLDCIEPYFPLSRGVHHVADCRMVSGVVLVIKNGLR